MKNKITSSLWIAGVLALAVAAPLSAGTHNDEFTAMDADRDGKITQSEHTAFSRSLFARSDANGDSRVTPSEWDAAAVAAKPGVKMDPADTAAQLFAMDSDGDGKVSTGLVLMSECQNNRWVVLEGLKTGEQVMVDGFQKLQMMPPGTPVKAVPWQPPVPASNANPAEPASAAASGAKS